MSGRRLSERCLGLALGLNGSHLATLHLEKAEQAAVPVEAEDRPTRDEEPAIPVHAPSREADVRCLGQAIYNTIRILEDYAVANLSILRRISRIRAVFLSRDRRSARIIPRAMRSVRSALLSRFSNFGFNINTSPYRSLQIWEFYFDIQGV